MDGSDSPAETLPLSVAEQIDSHWNYRDPAGSEAAFIALVDRARASDDPEFYPQLLSQIARCQVLQRRYDDAAHTLDEALRLASDRQASVAQVRCFLEVGRLQNDRRQHHAARKSFAMAFEFAKGLRETWLAVDAAHMLGVVEPYGEAAEWNRRAIELAAASDDPRARNWIATLGINRGVVLQKIGRFVEAQPAFEQAIPAAQQAGQEGRVRLARLCLSKNQRLLGDAAGALEAQRALLPALRAAGDHEGYIHEEMAEALLALGRAREARPLFAEAHRLLSTYPWYPPNEPERLARLRRLGEGE